MKSRSMLGLLAPAVFVLGCSQSDPGVTTSVKTQLMADELVKARNINVDTRDHVVTLTGTVQRARRRADDWNGRRHVDRSRSFRSGLGRQHHHQGEDQPARGS